MSEVKVNKISPRTACGTVTLGDSGDTFTIPSGATITNAGTASGFGATGETSWDTTVKTTGTFTATAGVGYFLNTTGGIITVNLAAGTAGDSVALADYAGTWQTNNVTVSPNGSEFIGGVNANVTLNTEGQAVTFVYIDGTQGWVNVLDSTSNVRGNPYMVATVSGACNTLATAPDCANVKIAKFVGPGTFTVCAAAACAANNVVSYMVVAGGGGGGVQGGGGGAGGYREVVSPSSPYTGSPLDVYPNAPNRITVTATGYPIVVGASGAGACFPSPRMGSKGSTSTFSTIDSAGGGGGKGYSLPAATAAPGFMNGGSGGAGGAGGGCSNPAGTGNTPPVTPSQGTNGGTSSGDSPPGFNGAGGGGATAAGTPTPGTGGGTAGGAGATTSIDGTPTARAGGGGGGGWEGTPPGPASAGGGAGGSGPSNVGGAGTINTGGGGGSSMSPCAAGYTAKGGAGGSGIVVIRYRFQ